MVAIPILYYAREVLLVQGWSAIWLTPLLSELVETMTLYFYCVEVA